MNLPGAQALDLRDIHAAAPPGFWPPAPGWWVLALLLAVLLALGLLWLRRRYLVRRFRNRVMHELETLGDRYQNDIDGLVTETGVWLRRIALQRFPKEEVASLNGSAWLEFLDTTGGAGEFRNGVGQVLETGPYRGGLENVSVDSLLALARRWGQANLEARS